MSIRAGLLEDRGPARGIVFSLLAICLPSFSVGQTSSFDSAGTPNEARVVPHSTQHPVGDWQPLYVVDFGPSQALAPGAISCDGVKAIRYATWRKGMVRPIRRASSHDPLTCDFIEGEDALLVLATDSTATVVRCVLTLGDPDAPRGPVRILLENRDLVPPVSTRAGEMVDIDFKALPSRGRIEIRFVAPECGSFAVNAAAVYAPYTRTLFELPGVYAFDPLQIDAAQHLEERQALARYADYLLLQRPREGCFSYAGHWYESSYAIRSLLVAARLLENPKYRDVALECLDRFVDEQRKDGSWSSQYFGHRHCGLAKETRERGASRNLADVGTMVLALSAAIPQAEPARRRTYLSAAMAFADSMVLPNQFPNGALPNLQFLERTYRHPYSVATGVNAANLAALYAVSGKRRYIDAAQKAAGFLARSIVDDGRVLFYPHHSDGAGLLDSNRLGDLYYILEGLLWVAQYADRSVRVAIDQALTRYFRGPWSPVGNVDPAEWLVESSEWERSKRAGFLFLVTEYEALSGSTPEIRSWIDRTLLVMSDTELSRGVGILCDPQAPDGGSAFFATALAGMAVASRVDVDVFFPARDPRRP